MQKIVINSVVDFQSLEGKQLGESAWLDINQEMINRFAAATLDHQWIHTDPERAEKESPFKTTIAHGYLILSLLPHFLNEIMEVKNLDRLINYGIDKMIFKNPLPSGSKLRMKATLQSGKDLGGIYMATIRCLFESDQQSETVLEGNIKYIYYFKN